MQNLYVMCGPSGSGKSTYIKENLRNCIVVSTDAIRKELWGAEEDQQNPQEVFEIAYARVELFLRAGYDVVFDATNLKARDRKKVAKIAERYGAKKNCIAMATPLGYCVLAQCARDRRVPTEVIESQFKHFQYPMLGEGWDEIRIIERI